MNLPKHKPVDPLERARDEFWRRRHKEIENERREAVKKKFAEAWATTKAADLIGEIYKDDKKVDEVCKDG